MPSKVKGGQTHKNGHVIRPKECFSILIETLIKFLTIPMQGKYELKDIHSLAIAMASQKQTIHSLTPFLSENMSETNFWYHVSKFNLQDLIFLNQMLLTNPVIDFLKRNIPYIFAIDETNDPYYGKRIDENEDYVIGGELKKSTTTFYKYITLELLLPQMKITLCVLPIEKGVKHEDYIQQMLKIIKGLGLSVKVLLLDRGFYSGEVFKVLYNNNIPFIMPVKKNSDKIIELLQGRRSRFAEYIMNEDKDPVKLTIAIRTCYLMGKHKKHERVNYGYVFFGLTLTPYKIAKIYEKRFGIESSYSIRNKVRPRTSTRSPSVRYYLFLVSMLFENVWMMLRWKYFRKPQRGPSKVDEDLFRFDNFRLKVWEYVKNIIQLIFETPTLRPG